MPSATFCDKYSVFEVHEATKEPKTTTDLVIVIGGCRGGQRRVGDHPLVLPDDGGAAADCGHRRDPGSPVAPRVRPLPAPHGRRPRLDGQGQTWPRGRFVIIFRLFRPIRCQIFCVDAR